MRLVVLVLAVMAAGCGFHRAKATLPPAEYDAFVKCYNFVSTRACSGRMDAARSACMSGVVDQYAELPGTAARRAYLVEAGCPSPVVARYFP